MTENKVKKFINIHLKILEEYFEIAVGYLSLFEPIGIEERNDELVITFEETNWNENLKNEIVELLQEQIHNCQFLKEEFISDKNWNEEWEKQTPAIIINDRIGIAPQWKINELQNEIKIIINPKMSFGTGEHTTTRLMALALDKIVQKDTFWIDAGTGTGVLAILAIKLGATHCLAFDNNSWAFENAEENIRLNNCQEKIELKDSDIDSIDLPLSDGIAANININILINSFRKFKEALKDNNSDLIVSGILKYDLDLALQSAKEAGLRHIQTFSEDEWIALHFKNSE
jgi:ribosomal protein L11 methyltransferase